MEDTSDQLRPDAQQERKEKRLKQIFHYANNTLLAKRCWISTIDKLTCVRQP